VDTRVIVMRLRKLDGYLLSLRQVQTVPLEEFLDDDGIQTYVERKLQLTIQVCMDIGNYLIGQLGLAVPDEAENVFAVLGREGVIERDLARRMVGMVRFRNILVHDYLDIDSQIVYHNLTDELGDFDRFAQTILDRFLPGDTTDGPMHTGDEK
jgi:uncharacterized protein YutE (UPF0331/DUF86 family)